MVVSVGSLSSDRNRPTGIVHPGMLMVTLPGPLGVTGLKVGGCEDFCEIAVMQAPKARVVANRMGCVPGV